MDRVQYPIPELLHVSRNALLLRVQRLAVLFACCDRTARFFERLRSASIGVGPVLRWLCACVVVYGCLDGGPNRVAFAQTPVPFSIEYAPGSWADHSSEFFIRRVKTRPVRWAFSEETSTATPDYTATLMDDSAIVAVGSASADTRVAYLTAYDVADQTQPMALIGGAQANDVSRRGDFSGTTGFPVQGSAGGLWRFFDASGPWRGDVVAAGDPGTFVANEAWFFSFAPTRIDTTGRWTWSVSSGTPIAGGTNVLFNVPASPNNIINTNWALYPGLMRYQLVWISPDGLTMRRYAGPNLRIRRFTVEGNNAARFEFSPAGWGSWVLVDEFVVEQGSPYGSNVELEGMFEGEGPGVYTNPATTIDLTAGGVQGNAAYLNDTAGGLIPFIPNPGVASFSFDVPMGTNTLSVTVDETDLAPWSDVLGLLRGAVLALFALTCGWWIISQLRPAAL